MMKMVHLRRRAVSDQALDWFVRMHSGECVETERQELLEWLALNELHLREYQRYASLWKDLDELSSMASAELEQARDKSSAQDHRGAARPTLGMPSIVQAPVTIAAMLMILIGGAWLWNQFSIDVTSYRTAKGEQKQITLADGSIIEMNTDTELSVHLSPQSRRIVLKRGEALFTVAHEPARLFSVVAGSGDIRDLGTQFAVYKRPDGVMVSVLEGSVEVSRQGPHSMPNDHNATALLAGDRLFYTSGIISPLQKVDRKTAASWRSGKLIFDGMSLADVIQEMSRYRTTEIRITDRSLGELKVSGVFHLKNDVHAFFRALERILPVTVSMNGPLIVLDRAERP